MLAHKGTCHPCYQLQFHLNIDYFVVRALKRTAEFSLGTKKSLSEKQNQKSLGAPEHELKACEEAVSEFPSGAVVLGLVLPIQRMPCPPPSHRTMLLAAAFE